MPRIRAAQAACSLQRNRACGTPKYSGIFCANTCHLGRKGSSTYRNKRWHADASSLNGVPTAESLGLLCLFRPRYALHGIRGPEDVLWGTLGLSPSKAGCPAAGSTIIVWGDWETIRLRRVGPDSNPLRSAPDDPLSRYDIQHPHPPFPSMTPLKKLLSMRKSHALASGRVAYVHWDRDWIYYLIVSSKSNALRAHDVGACPREVDQSPFETLSSHFNAERLSASKLVVLLSRPDLEMLTIGLPPASREELPVLIAAAVEQQLGDSESEFAVDYFSSELPAPYSNEEATHFAFVMGTKELAALEQAAGRAGFQIIAVGSRHLSPLGVLQHGQLSSQSLSVWIHLYSGEAEFAVCLGTTPIYLRSLRLSGDDMARSAEQIRTESQRCLSLLPEVASEEAPTWFVFSSCSQAFELAAALEQVGPLDVQTVDPLMGWDCSELETKDPSNPIYSAACAGAAWDARQTLPVDLRAPKRAPKAPNPAVRWAVIGTAALATLALGVYFLLADLRDLRAEVTGLEKQLGEAQKLAAKYGEQESEVLVVENWLADRVDWLSELNTLSERFPEGPAATVRRLTATAADNSAVIDLSIRVAQQEHISLLENSVRSVKYQATSKRISQTADSSEYPWQFETRISFPIEDSLSKKSYQPPRKAPVSEEATSDAAVSAEPPSVEEKQDSNPGDNSSRAAIDNEAAT